MQNRIESIITGQRARQEPLGEQVPSGGRARAPKAFTRIAKRVESGIAEHPAISLSVGLAIGAAIGWYLKRK